MIIMVGSLQKCPKTLMVCESRSAMPHDQDGDIFVPTRPKTTAQRFKLDLFGTPEWFFPLQIDISNFSGFLVIFGHVQAYSVGSPPCHRHCKQQAWSPLF